MKSAPGQWNQAHEPLFVGGLFDLQFLDRVNPLFGFLGVFGIRIFEQHFIIIDERSLPTFSCFRNIWR